MPEAAAWWYELDADDRVAAAHGAWDACAPRNGVAQCPLGQSLWTLVDGIETVHVLRRIIAGVRKSGAAVEVPFRCDGPAVERHMQFRAAPLDGGRVRIATRLLFELPAHGTSAPPAPFGAEAMICMCSWCSRIRAADGSWLPPAEVAARLGMFCGVRMPAITHGICGACLTIMDPLLADEPLTPNERHAASA